MFQLNLVSALVLAILAVGIRCQSGEDSDSPSERLIGLLSRVPSYDYDFGRSCEAETHGDAWQWLRLSQDLQKLMVDTQP